MPQTLESSSLSALLMTTNFTLALFLPLILSCWVQLWCCELRDSDCEVGVGVEALAWEDEAVFNSLDRSHPWAKGQSWGTDCGSFLWHCNPVVSHTLSLITQHYWWPSLYKDAFEFVSDCPVFAHSKVSCWSFSWSTETSMCFTSSLIPHLNGLHRFVSLWSI